MRLAYYAGVSTAAAAACLLKAFHERPNFYSATVYLSQSNACLLILTNLLLVMACSFMYGLQRLLYGPLRPIEIEQLSEKAWYAVLDTLLAMPSFREDVGGWLLAMFTLLLAGKVWGWIGEGKVDVLEQQPPADPKLFHTRLVASLLLSVVFDLCMLEYCVESVLADPRPGMMVIFTFEFAVLSVSSSFTLSRYTLSLIQSRIEGLQMKKAIDDRKSEIRAERAAARQNETADGQVAPASSPNEEPIEVDENEIDVPGWEEKRRYLFALEVFTDFIKLMIYIVFFTVSITFNGLPMHIMRDVYMTFASFSKRVSDYVAYRKATSDMNTRYPDATTEEIRGDACIVCRETMVAWEQPNAQAQAQPAAEQPQATLAPTRRRDEGLRAKKLPCGHILHLRCLKAWLERQQVCPTCRRPVVTPRDPASPGQQGAAGANAAAPGQQARQPAQGPNRARIFNLGPVRIGFLNGPGDQIQNLIQQMQGQRPAAGQNAAQDPNQQGPNHLGLQVPYANGPQQAATTTTSTAPSTQAQIFQIEQRLMQDAQNLGIAQQQLATLRAMEQELTRLRTLQTLPQQANATATATQRPVMPQVPQLPPFAQAPGYLPLHHAMPFHNPYLPFSATAFHGNAGQQFGNGHESLPPGLSLPEGWTAMPLRPAGATATPQVHVQQAGGQQTQAGDPPSSVRAPTTGADVNQSATTQQNGDPTVGPTDDNGSPLFVPSVPNTNGTLPAASDAPSSQLAPSEEQSSSQPVTNEHTAPWASEGWSFVDPPNGQTQNGERSEELSNDHPATNGGPPEAEDEGHTDKGKGKAAEVEEVADSGA